MPDLDLPPHQAIALRIPTRLIKQAHRFIIESVGMESPPFERVTPLERFEESEPNVRCAETGSSGAGS